MIFLSYTIIENRTTYIRSEISHLQLLDLTIHIFHDV